MFHIRREFDETFGTVKARYEVNELEQLLRVFVKKTGNANKAIDILLWYWMHAVNCGVDPTQPELVKALEQHVHTMRMQVSASPSSIDLEY